MTLVDLQTFNSDRQFPNLKRSFGMLNCHLAFLPLKVGMFSKEQKEFTRERLIEIAKSQEKIGLLEAMVFDHSIHALLCLYKTVVFRDVPELFKKGVEEKMLARFPELKAPLWKEGSYFATMGKISTQELEKMWKEYSEMKVEE